MMLQALVVMGLTVWSCHGSAIPSFHTASNCKFLPGDPQWPTTEQWTRLNDTVGGRLISNIPIASVCHTSNFTGDTCTKLQQDWIFTEPHFESSSSVMQPYFLNNSCSPFPSANPSSCTLGNLASYSINVSSAADVTAGVLFTKEHNIRLIVKNTGHDYLGRSTGQGALSLWMHNLKDITFFDYSSSAYTGSAARLGAGVQGFDAYIAADAQSLRIVAGYCPTVGTVGGYNQGGGFSPLSAAHGLSPDNALEYDVVTATGEHLTVNQDQNADLYWALSGGGGGTYAVVLSMVTKTFADGPVGGAMLRLNHTQSDSFWEVVTFWETMLLDLALLPGFQSAFQIGQTTFSIRFVTWLGHTAAEIAAKLEPMVTYLNAHNMVFTFETSDDPTFHTHFARYEHNLPHGLFTISDVIGSRFIPRNVIESNASEYTNALRTIIADGRFFLGAIQTNVSHARAGNEPGSNAVLPAWRDALLHNYVEAAWDPASPLDTLHTLYADMNNFVLPLLKDLTPGGGGYMNENTFDDPFWKEDYFGVNYDRLLEVKRKYDPDFQLYSRPSVGHEFFEVGGDGRLCRI